MTDAEVFDLLVVGGGVNGCGIARDAAGRGLSVMLCEEGDLARGTSSASTKLFHGGLRYLEYYEFRLVREALRERETLLRMMPHISRPLRFVLPQRTGLRPAWLIRLGLFLYDHLGGRELLPGTRSLDLTRDPAGTPLKPGIVRAFEYSDCWIDDARLVVLNARGAADLGARIAVGTRCVAAERRGGVWHVTLEDATRGARSTVVARALVNAAGPWVEDVIGGVLRSHAPARTRLVRGSHIVVRRLFDHDRAYILQTVDRRIVFAIPYEDDFTLIGTTDMDHQGAPEAAVCTPQERDYLCAVVSDYFARPVGTADVVWTYSGVRPLYDDGASSNTAATRDYVITLDDSEAPAVHLFGGKITTYRRLAEAVLARLRPRFPGMGEPWTAASPLPGGDFPVDGLPALTARLRAGHPFLDVAWARRLARAYGTCAEELLAGARAPADLGQSFGASLTEAEVRWMMRREWARSAEDVLWRRSKLGLRLSAAETGVLGVWMARERATVEAAA